MLVDLQLTMRVQHIQLNCEKKVHSVHVSIHVICTVTISCSLQNVHKFVKLTKGRLPVHVGLNNKDKIERFSMME